MSSAATNCIDHKLAPVVLSIVHLVTVTITPAFGADQGAFTFSAIELPGFIVGAVGISAHAINNSGQIVGDNGIEGFLRDRTGQYSPFSVSLPNALGTAPLAISNSGIIVGYYTARDGSHGFIKNGGNYTRVDAPGVGTWNRLTAINNRGEILGSYLDGPNSVVFVLKDGIFTTINLPTDQWKYAEATGINDAGHVVGSMPFHVAGFCHSGFVYDGGALETINFPGAKETFASGINNRDQIVGYYRYDCEAGFHYAPAHGFLYVKGRFTKLDFPGAQDTWAYGVDDAGEVVGTFSDGTHWHGFVATPTP